MNLRTLVLATSLLLSTLACGGVTPGSIDIPSVALTDPWSGMNMPVGDGAVTYSDATQMTVTYQSKKLEKITKDYEKSIKDAGWNRDSETDAGGAKVVTFKKDGKTLTLTAAEAAGFQTISMIILDF